MYTALATIADTFRWPTDADVEEAFLTRPMYSSLGQDRLRLLFGALDERMHADHVKGERPHFDYQKLQIEHIIPIAWRQNWPVSGSDGAAQQLAEQDRDRAVNRIGNLTLQQATAFSSPDASKRTG